MFRILLILTFLSGNLLAESSPPDSTAADQALYSGRYQQAAQLYTALLKQNPDWAPGYYGLVRSLIEANRSREAYDAAKTGLDRLPNAPETLTAAGLAAFRRAEIAEADALFTKARQQSPQYPGALLGMADIQRCLSRFKTAHDLETFAYRKLAADPELARAQALTLQGPDRIAALEKILASYDPASPEARYLRVSIATYRALGDRKLRQLTSPYRPYKINLFRIQPNANIVRGLGVTLKLNGRESVHLMLDTGASGISITPKAAARAGLEILSAEAGEAHGIGDNKPLESSRFLAASIDIGDLHFANYPLSAFRSAKDSDADGLIGADVFRAFLVTVDFPAATLQLDPFPDGPAANDDPQDAPALSPGFFRAIRFGSHLALITRVNETARALFLIDSGSSSNLIDSEFASTLTKVRGDDWTTLRGVQGKVKEVSRADKITLTFAGFRQQNPDLLALNLTKLSDDFGAAFGGIIGFPVLSYLKMTIDYRAGAVRMVRGN